MAQLPEGFVLDEPMSAAGGAAGVALPPGFVLDEPSGAETRVDQRPGQRGDGAFMNTTAGLNEGIYGTLGAPVDLAAGAINLGVRGINAATGTELPTIQDPIGGSRSIAQAFGAAGVPDPADIEAATAGEKIARGAGQGIGYMVAPELAARGVAQAAGRTIGPWLRSIFGESRTVGDVAGNALAGAAGGAGASLAGQVAPESARPLAEMAGGLVGGGLGALAASTPRIAAEGARMAGDYIAPLTEAGRERLAATSLRDAASDPAAARDALARNGELVPGSQPTTFQQSGDMGLGALERAVSALSPDQFMQRRSDQNAARLDALGDVQSQGSPQAIVSALRANLADLDEMTGEALQGATRTAQERAAAIGGAGTPEGYGSAVRQRLMDAENTARERERALWGAVDPDGSLALPTGGVRQEVEKALGSLPQAARPMEGEERAIFAAAGGFGPVMPFKEVTALRSRVSTEMRRELSQNGRSPVYARLSQLRGAIERNIEDAVTGKAAQEAEAVASGAMRQEDTMAALVAGWRDGWREEQATRARADAGAGSDGSSGAGGFSGARGSAGQGRGEFSGAAGSQGIPGDQRGLAPNFDAGAKNRLNAASEATKQRAQTYGRGPVGDVLRRSGSEGPYNVPSSAVAERFFRPGSKGYENVQALRQAAGDPETVASIRDYALSTLRRSAMREDGTLDPAKVQLWKSRYRDALRAFPEIDGMVADPVRASQAMEQLAVQRKQSFDTYRQGLTGRLIGVDNPEDVTRAIGSVFTSPQPATLMRQLAEQVRGNGEAVEGLRKAVADSMVQRLVSNAEVATSGRALIKADQFQNFVRQNEAALKEVLKPAEISMLKAIGDDLQRANRSITSVKLPGGSNTAQDLVALAQSSQPQSWGRIFLAALAQGGGGFALGGPIGGIAAIGGGQALAALRRAGMEKVDDLLTDAMLNPQRGLLLLTKAPPKPTEKDVLSFLQRFTRTMVNPADGE
ncbi:hypothetical protein [Ancylobacter sp.]|uniref:hypothetical protein n=1 Tax=Ancylobacter sp. TaxID=1872567 RepID=UPI003D12867D